jgi:protein involved in polysaccharide export with SLBB domain
MNRSLCLLVAAFLSWGIGAARGGLAVGDEVEVSLKGVPAGEQEQFNGRYTVREGGIRLPLLEGLVPVVGMAVDQAARTAETAYRKAGIYENPAIEMRVLRGKDVAGDDALVSVGGRVKRAGQVPYRKGMTLTQAIQAAGDRDDFGGSTVILERAGKARKLDYRKQEDRNLPLLPNDTITVQQRKPFE